MLSTNRPDEAEHVLSGNVSRMAFTRVDQRSPFGFVMNAVSLGQFIVFCNRYEADCELDLGEVPDLVSVAISRGGVTRVLQDSRPVHCRGNRAALITPRHRVVIERPARSELLVVGIAERALRRRLREETGRQPPGVMDWPWSIDFSEGAPAFLWQTVRYAVTMLDENPALAQDPYFVRGIQDLLLSGFVTLPHSLSQFLHAMPKVAVAATVRRAEEYMEAHALEPLTISDVVEAIGCSRSALFQAFRKHRTYSPLKFLQGVRLDLAHRSLVDAEPTHSVTSIALACGFRHLSRFAQAYRQRYGESPRDTLGRAAPG